MSLGNPFNPTKPKSPLGAFASAFIQAIAAANAKPRARARPQSGTRKPCNCTGRRR